MTGGRRHAALIACLIPFALLTADAHTRSQEPIPPSIVDGVVKAVCGKQIVLLGELPSHGEAQAFDAKSKIADRLITQCGFTAILFEAPIYDFLGFERAAKSGPATQEQLDNAIGRFWWTRELTPWRRGLFDAATRRRLVIGGLDDQVSITSHYAMDALPRLIAAAFPDGRAAACRQVITRHLGYTYDAANPFDEPEKMRLQECARNAANAAAADRSVNADDRVMLESFARYADRQRASAAVGRDESMYRNFLWYLDQWPPKSRIVIWTATVHAARQRGSLADVPLGARIAEKFGDRAGAVGFTA